MSQSSFHLRWDIGTSRQIIRASATVEVMNLPAASDKGYFWAIEGRFCDDTNDFGSGHLGLQWWPQHPDNRAVNWGGYRRDGSEWSGSTSTLPCSRTPPNVNTRDYHWEPLHKYRLTIRRAAKSAGNT